MRAAKCAAVLAAVHACIQAGGREGVRALVRVCGAGGCEGMPAVRACVHACSSCAKSKSTCH